MIDLPASTHHHGTRHSTSLPSSWSLSGLAVAVVVVVLAHRDDDVHRRLRDPRLEPALDVVRLVRELGDPARGSPRSVTTTMRTPCAEAAARRLPAAGDDPFDRLAVDRIVRVAPNHLPATEDVGKLHGAHDDGHDTHGRRAGAGHGRPGAPRLPRRGDRRSLDLALYDFKLGPGLEELVVDTIDEAGTRGVAVRLVYNADFRAPIPVPPPPQPAPEDVARLSRADEADRRRSRT